MTNRFTMGGTAKEGDDKHSSMRCTVIYGRIILSLLHSKASD